MTQTASAPESVNRDWRSLCCEHRIDPVEVEMVSSRYLAYRDYMKAHGDGLSLAVWFRFYCQEKASESGTQTGGVGAVSYTHLRAPETVLDLACRLLLEKKKN